MSQCQRRTGNLSAILKFLGAGTNDEVLIEIMASRTGEQIKEIIKVYKKEFGGKLEKDICGDTTGHYQKLLVILLQVERGAAGKTYVSFPDNENLWRRHYKVMRFWCRLGKWGGETGDDTTVHCSWFL
ncbi:annexin A5-like isoform X1 [Lates japonicus]|uniref:Annexin n=1 Tax=Lates japonicus TaxID=270547 RepID=A0AAD3MK08_LATJO|nr:annexin A5-like isoform X1 [Lates japonicus]